MPIEVPEERAAHGGPYRTPVRRASVPHPSEWRERGALVLVATPWLVPLGRALAGREPFGWSATVGLMACLVFVTGAARWAAAHVRGVLR